MLRYVPSILTLLSFYHEWMLNFFKLFLHLLRWSCDFSLFTWYITLIALQILNHFWNLLCSCGISSDLLNSHSLSWDLALAYNVFHLSHELFPKVIPPFIKLSITGHSCPFLQLLIFLCPKTSLTLTRQVLVMKEQYTKSKTIQGLRVEK